MKSILIYLITLVLAGICNLAFAQAPVKQVSGGSSSVQNPSHALGSDLSKYSTLKLKNPTSKKDYLYQTFVFAQEGTKDNRIVFVVRADEDLSFGNNIPLNLKLYSMHNGVSDTTSINDVQITQVNKVVGLYELSFVAPKNFNAAGILLQGGGLLRMVNVYKVYMAINSGSTFRFVSAKR